MEYSHDVNATTCEVSDIIVAGKYSSGTHIGHVMGGSKSSSMLRVNLMLLARVLEDAVYVRCISVWRSVTYSPTSDPRYEAI